MDSNENTRTNMPEDAILLGIASVETKGFILGDEGVGGIIMPGISEE